MQWGNYSISKLEEMLNDTDFEVEDVVKSIESYGGDTRDINNHFKTIYELQMYQVIDFSSREFTDEQVEELTEVYVNDVATSYVANVNFGTTDEMIEQIEEYSFE
jgi:hypothetical protein